MALSNSAGSAAAARSACVRLRAALGCCGHHHLFKRAGPAAGLHMAAGPSFALACTTDTLVVALCAQSAGQRPAAMVAVGWLTLTGAAGTRHGVPANPVFIWKIPT